MEQILKVTWNSDFYNSYLFTFYEGNKVIKKYLGGYFEERNGKIYAYEAAIGMDGSKYKGKLIFEVSLHDYFFIDSTR